MAAILVLVMADGCVTELVDGVGHWAAGFGGTDPDCPELVRHILTTLVMLRSRRTGGSPFRGSDP